MERAQAKLKGEVAGVGDIDMRGVGAAHKRQRKPKGSKEERTKKPNGAEAMGFKGDKAMGLKLDDAMEVLLVGGGSKQKGGKRMEEVGDGSKGEDVKRRKTKLGGASKEEDVKRMKTKLGGGSKQEDVKRRKTKLVTRRLSQDLLEYLRTKEVMGFIATEMPRPLRPSISGELFGRKLKQKIAAQFEENREFESFILYQYRTNGCAEIQVEVNEEELEEGDELVEEGDELVEEGDELVELKGVMGAGVGSKEKSGKRSPSPLEDVLIDELITYMVSEPLRVFVDDHFSDEVFDTYLDARISASYKKRRRFNAIVIQQYRMNGYTDFQFEVNDNKKVTRELEEELTWELEGQFEVNDNKKVTRELEEELTWELEELTTEVEVEVEAA